MNLPGNAAFTIFFLFRFWLFIDGIIHQKGFIERKNISIKVGTTIFGDCSGNRR